MTGLPLIIAFIIAIVLMILAISKFKIHPFLAIMAISLILGLVAGIPSYSTVDIDFGYVDYTKIITPRWHAQTGYKASTRPDTSNY